MDGWEEGGHVIRGRGSYKFLGCLVCMEVWVRAWVGGWVGESKGGHVIRGRGHRYSSDVC